MNVNHEEVGSPEETGNQEDKWAELEELGKQGFHPEKKERNVFQKAFRKIQTKRAEKLLSKGNQKSTTNAIHLIESGDVDLSNPELVDRYIDLKMSKPEYYTDQDGHFVHKTMLQKIEDIKELGLPVEKPISIVVDNAISEINRSVESEYHDGYSEQLNFSTTKVKTEGEVGILELNEIIKKYNAEEAKNKIQENVNVQLFGDKVVESILANYIGEENYPNNEEQKNRAIEGINFLKELGYEPFKNSLEPLFYPNHKKWTATQEKQLTVQKLANELGLINKETVDKMYRFQIDSINDYLMSSGLGDPDPVSVYRDLECSGKDKLAIFVKEQEDKTDGSFLSNIIEKGHYRSSPSIATEIIRQYGEGEGGTEIDDSMKFLLENPEITNGPDHGYLICIKNLMHRCDTQTGDSIEKQRNTIKLINDRLQSYRFDNGVPQRTFFDENGISTTGKELAMFDTTGMASRIVEDMDPEWTKGYPDEMKKLIEMWRICPKTIMEHNLLGEFSPERQSLITLEYKYPKLELRDIRGKDIRRKDARRYFNPDGSATTEFVEYIYENDRVSINKIPEIKSLLPEEKQAYIDTLSIVNANKTDELYNLTDKQISEFFDADGPKKELWGHLFQNANLDEIQTFIEQTASSYEDLGLTTAQIELLKYYEKLYRNPITTGERILQKSPFGRSIRKRKGRNHSTGLSVLKNAIKDGLVDEFFDEKGPTNKLWSKFFETGNFDILQDEKEEGTDLGLTENGEESVGIYSLLEKGEMREIFKDFAIQYCDKVPKERLKIAPDVLYRLHDSNSYEMGASASKLAMQLLPLDPDNDNKLYERIEKIEDIFLRNNLPYVGKVFSTFRILHPPEQFSTGELYLSMRGALKDLPDQGVRSREAVLWNDVLKATIGSNNRNLIEYLKNLEKDEHLEVLADNTAKARETGENPDAFAPTKRYTMADRIIRSFAYGLGYETFEQFKQAVENIPKQADARNRERLKNNDFSLGKGDLVKSTSIEYLGAILQNGAVSKEFLNGQAESDSTPLDSDCGMFEEDFATISEAIDHKNTTNAFGAMHCILVFKSDESTGRNRFQNEGEGPYDPTKYEIWNNGGENHGIRVGIPSSEIDFIVYDDLGNPDNYGNLNQIKFEIARNGFFIPIVDKNTGKPVFSEEEYENIRRKMSGLKEYGAGDYVPLPNEQLQIKSIEVEVPDMANITIPSTAELIASAKDNERETDEKRNAIINQILKPVLAEYGFEFKPSIDGDISEGTAEVIDTGSTGRYSNAPKDGDFDFMMKLDLQFFRDSEKFNDFRNKLLERMGATTPEEQGKALANGNIRIKNVKLESLDEPVDIDITFTHKTNKVQFSTDMALKEYYDSMPPEVREQVVANVLFAKKYLKAKKVYKRQQSDQDQGGLGGVGVENWIIQNGGSFIAAAKEFMAVAEQCESFEEFKSKYAIWDFGENHMIRGVVSHDNFVVHNMNAYGYKKMKDALKEFLAQA